MIYIATHKKFNAPIPYMNHLYFSKSNKGLSAHNNLHFSLKYDYLYYPSDTHIFLFPLHQPDRKSVV